MRSAMNVLAKKTWIGNQSAWPIPAYSNKYAATLLARIETAKGDSRISIAVTNRWTRGNGSTNEHQSREPLLAKHDWHQHQGFLHRPHMPAVPLRPTLVPRRLFGRCGTQ